MRGSFGEHFKLTIFGESHGPAIGIVLDGVPPGTVIDEEAIAVQMARRAPGLDPTATARREADRAEILSGVVGSTATGTPLCAVIRNTNAHSGDYSELADKPRPGHADYAGFVRYAGYNDVRGGGHFSGRLTAPLVFAGAVARQILRSEGILIGSHIARIAGCCDAPLNPLDPGDSLLERLSSSSFPLVDPEKEAEMRKIIASARDAQDSTGGIIEAAAVHVPPGIGSPFFGSVESVFSQLAFSVPAVKAVEFGDGTHMADLRGSQANDPLTCLEDGTIRCLSNHNGGITGGITNGMPVLTRVTLKPTPSISRPQKTVSLSRRCNTELEIHGRHDPCIVPRAASVIESILAITLCELMMDRKSQSPSAT